MCYMRTSIGPASYLFMGVDAIIATSAKICDLKGARTWSHSAKSCNSTVEGQSRIPDVLGSHMPGLYLSFYLSEKNNRKINFMRVLLSKPSLYN